MKADHGKPLWSSWSKQLEEGCSYNPAEADDAEEQLAQADEAEQERRLDAEMLAELNAEAGGEDLYVLYSEFFVRILRHIDKVPNQDHQKAVRAWLLKDFDVSPTFKPGGFPVGETLRGAAEWLLVDGVVVREKNGALKKRLNGYPDGQLYPQGAKDLVVKGLAFCYATELWLTEPRSKELGWDALLEKCEKHVISELKGKNSFTKAKRSQ